MNNIFEIILISIVIIFSIIICIMSTKNIIETRKIKVKSYSGINYNNVSFSTYSNYYFSCKDENNNILGDIYYCKFNKKFMFKTPILNDYTYEQLIIIGEKVKELNINIIKAGE
jgi:hypothetical protein